MERGRLDATNIRARMTRPLRIAEGWHGHEWTFLWRASCALVQ